MSAPQGSDLVFGYGFERQDNIWQPADINKFLPLKSLAGLVAKRPLTRTQNMDPSGQMLGGRNLQGSVAPKIDFEPGVDELAPLLAHMNGYYSFGAQLGTGPYPLTTRPKVSGDSVAKYVDSLVMTASDGDGSPVLTSGNRAQDLDYTIADGKLNALAMSFLGCYDTYSDDASVAVGGTYTGKPILRGHWDDQKVGPLKVKVSVVAGGGFDGTILITAGVTAYGATAIQIKFDTWYPVVMSSDGSRLGYSKIEDLWICFPSNASTVLALNQEWTIANSRAVPTPSYSGRNPLTAAACDILVDEGLSTQANLYVHTLAVKRTRPRKANFTNGSKYARTIQKNGNWTVTLTIDRDREDRSMLIKLINSKTINVRTYCYGDPFGTSGYDELWKSEYPFCQVADDIRDVTTPNVLPEKITLEATRNGSTAMFTDTVNTSLSTL